MHSSRETIILNAVCVVLVAMTGVIRLIRHNFPQISGNLIIFLLFAVSAFIWISQINKRLIQSEERKYIIAMELMILFMMVLRTVKFVFLPDGNIVTRYIWYLYYLPQTVSVLWMLFAVLHIGKPQGQPINPRWKLLYIPAALIVLGVLTNDLHGLAFNFTGGIEHWHDSKYTYGPVYYISVLWLFVMFVMMLAIVFSRCKVSENRKRIWLPVAPLALEAAYTVAYILVPDTPVINLFRSAEVISFVFPAFMECLILTGLFPSNDSYDMLWKNSNIGCGIMDKEGNICHRSHRCIVPAYADILEAEHEEVLLDNGNTLLKSHRIKGGYSYWTKDISEIKRLNEQLEALGDILEKENSILENENRLKEKRLMLEEKNRLYSDIASRVKPQLDKLSRLLNAPPEDEQEFESTMKRAAVLNAYIKRYSNILLFLHKNKKIYSDELSLAFSESLEYVRMCGIYAHGEYKGECVLQEKAAMLLYELFEEALELAMPDVSAVLVNLNINEDITLRIELSSPSKLLCENYKEDTIKMLNGRLNVLEEDGIEYICLVLPEKGG
ncbi:uncharacterized protein BN818_01809 [Clostridium sp. CAG:964]|nr:uncharacterized protein BN818_01809 [Clostridium sp. CAG:964]